MRADKILFREIFAGGVCVAKKDGLRGILIIFVLVVGGLLFVSDNVRYSKSTRFVFVQSVFSLLLAVILPAMMVVSILKKISALKVKNEGTN